MADDPTGRIITLDRDFLEAAGYTVWRSAAHLGVPVRGTERGPGDAPPMVQVVPIVVSPALTGARAGVTEWRHAHRCYGPKGIDGDRQAQALALALYREWEAFRQGRRPPLTFAAPDQPGRTFGIYTAVAESMVGPVTDRDTGEPVVVLTTRIIAPGASWP